MARKPNKIHSVINVTGGTYWSYWDRAGQTKDDASRATYLNKSDCFLGVLKVPSSPTSGLNEEMTLVFANWFGRRNYAEACTAVTLMKGNGSDGSGSNRRRASTTTTMKAEVMTAGHTEEDGFLTSLRPIGSLKWTMYGFLLNMNLDITNVNIDQIIVNP